MKLDGEVRWVRWRCWEDVRGSTTLVLAHGQLHLHTVDTVDAVDE